MFRLGRVVQRVPVVEDGLDTAGTRAENWRVAEAEIGVETCLWEGLACDP